MVVEPLDLQLVGSVVQEGELHLVKSIDALVVR